MIDTNEQKNSESTAAQSDNNSLLSFSSSMFNSYSNLNVSNSNEDPVIVNDDDVEDTEHNIGLVHKQPSYLSLSDVVITKRGDVIHDSNSILNVENDGSNDSNINLSETSNRANLSKS